ncbi:hypothetical protein, partial [Klebsiella pneumoniae]|uniref:hypothetical protein n=1 Tax=Klebsiella pneumoniae TaxID=573 RepID=UPI00237DC8A6
LFRIFIQDDISASVFNRISDNANWKLTKLNERSEDIFSKLSSCNTGRIGLMNKNIFLNRFLSLSHQGITLRIIIIKMKS